MIAASDTAAAVAEVVAVHVVVVLECHQVPREGKVTPWCSSWTRNNRGGSTASSIPKHRDATVKRVGSCLQVVASGVVDYPEA